MALPPLTLIVARAVSLGTGIRTLISFATVVGP